jgi:peptidoglycan/LPS O-acetylase OafA/YrhL
MQSENRPLTAVRGFAALWVVGLHLDMGWNFPVGPRVHAVLLIGRVAVDVFFVLSGFILTLVYRDLTGRGFGAFALRRICRIYPLHLSVMVWLGAAELYTTLHAGKVHPWGEFWPTLLLVQPYLGITSAWNLPSWSLGVEMMCYALFPFANLLLRPVGTRGLLAAVLGIGCIESVVLYFYNDAVAGPGAVLRALAGFALGCALARLFLMETAGFARYRGPLQVMALAALVIAVFATDLPAILFAAATLIAVIACSTGPVARALSLAPFVWLGRISFSIYLLHLPLAALFGKLPVLRPALDVPSLRLVVAAVFIAVLLALSEVTYQVIERPFRRLPGLVEHRRADVTVHGVAQNS